MDQCTPPVVDELSAQPLDQDLVIREEPITETPETEERSIQPQAEEEVALTVITEESTVGEDQKADAESMDVPPPVEEEPAGEELNHEIKEEDTQKILDEKMCPTPTPELAPETHKEPDDTNALIEACF